MKEVRNYREDRMDERREDEKEAMKVLAVFT